MGFRRMMPLGLDAPGYDAYVARLFGSHDFAADVDILYLDERQRGRLTGEFIDAQVNVQDEQVRRSATFSLHDPDHALEIDAESPYEGAVYLDRMIRARHAITVPGIGPVGSVPFIGPITKITREGSVLTVEAQDKAILSLDGRPPMTWRKGTKAVNAIKAFMRATGETRFRFAVPANKANRRLPRDYSIGWDAEASPFAVSRLIANNVLGMELEYACDGALMLRNTPTTPVLTYTMGANVVGQIKVDYDASTVRNHVRVSGAIPASGKRKKEKKFTITRTAPTTHPMSPKALGRNGAWRYLPLLVEDSAINSRSKGWARAASELNAALPLRVNTSWAGVPVFHLDYGDLVELDTPDGRVVTPFREASIPLGLGGDASLGTQRRVSRPRRTGRRAS